MLVDMDEEQDGEAGSGTVRRVRSWLKDTGYTLELRTAAAFRAEGLATEAARYYVAEDSETLREMDVVATAWQARPGPNAAWLEVVHVLECKGASEHPWVAFQGDDRFTRDEDVLSTMRVDRRGGTFDHSTGEDAVASFRVKDFTARLCCSGRTDWRTRSRRPVASQVRRTTRSDRSCRRSTVTPETWSMTPGDRSCVSRFRSW